MKFLPLILKNLFRNKRRTILTVMSLAVSLFVFAALISLPGVVNQILRARANSLRLISHSKGGYSYPLPEAYRRRIASMAHVDLVTGENIFMGTYLGPHDQIPSVAVDPEDIDAMFDDFGITRQAAAEFERVRGAALAGEFLMKRYRWRIGDNVTLRGTIYPVDVALTIVGTLGGTSARYAVLFRRDYLKEMLHSQESVHLFWVKVDRLESIPGVIGAIDRTFANSPAETLTESEVGASMSQMGFWRLLFDGVKVLAAIVIVAIAAAAANTAAMSVRERRPEIAVMRSIGFTREAMLIFIVAEGLIIGVVGGLFGCAMAYLAL